MRALGEQRINPFVLTNNPNPIVLFVLFADFSESVIGWQPHLQYRWRLKENSGEGRANETKQSGRGNKCESRPTHSRYKIPAAPNALPFACGHPFPSTNTLSVLNASCPSGA